VFVFQIAVLDAIQRLLGQTQHHRTLGGDGAGDTTGDLKQLIARYHPLDATETVGVGGADHLPGEVQVTDLLHRKQALQMGTAPHGAAVDLRYAETGAFGGDDNIGSAGDADATAEHEAMHRRDHRLGVAVHRLEGGVVAGVHLDDAPGMRSQLLDVDPGAEAPAMGTEDDHLHLIGATKFVDGAGQSGPAGGVEGIDRGCAYRQLRHAPADLDMERLSHAISSEGLCCSWASEAIRSWAWATMFSISSATVGKASMTAATWPLGSTPSAGWPSTIARWITTGALAAINTRETVASSARSARTPVLSSWRALIPV